MERLNHVGDWGTQFGMLIEHLSDQAGGAEKQGASVADLQVRPPQSSNAHLLWSRPCNCGPYINALVSEPYGLCLAGAVQGG